MTPNRWITRLSALLLVTTVGCAHGETSGPSAATSPARDGIETRPYFPFEQRAGTYRVWVDGGDPVEHAFTLEPTDGDTWLFRLHGRRTVRLGRWEEGATRVHGERVPVEGVRTVYRPPLLMLPARLDAASPATGSVETRILNLDDGSERDHGACAFEIRAIDRKPVDTPVGERPGLIVRTERTLELGLARVEVATVSTYARGVGLVAQRTTRETKALGLLSDTTTERMELVKLGDG